uniref:NADH-ubiquinone oxidoreductase chain 1 n=1 Tax=Euretidae gen. sp. DVL-2014 TaxID=1569957 RepID=A0A0N7AFR3_9METZ|nr:NADH dehydrogenase subunit 1 [Euretidae gen. sp. DVL-2014]
MTLKTIQNLTTIITILLATAFLTLIERKILASTQIRKGPNIVGIYGLSQPIADAIKLIIKETINYKINHFFIITPIITISIAFTAWTLIPLDNKSPQSSPNIGMMLIFALSSLSVYSILLSGWASNSKYALLGSIRATAQMISYEVAIGIIILTAIYLSSSLNLSTISITQQFIWYIIPLFPAFTMFLISSIAETNRTPFDLTESESELVSGFNTEYSSILFTLLFLAEYINILLMASILSILFLSNDTLLTQKTPLISSTKIIIITYIFIWIRSTYPRMRYDQLMNLLWKSYLPLSLTLTIILPSIILLTTIHP